MVLPKTVFNLKGYTTVISNILLGETLRIYNSSADKQVLFYIILLIWLIKPCSRSAAFFSLRQGTCNWVNRKLLGP